MYGESRELRRGWKRASKDGERGGRGCERWVKGSEREVSTLSRLYCNIALLMMPGVPKAFLYRGQYSQDRATRLTIE